jgi:hypothetical protein
MTQNHYPNVLWSEVLPGLWQGGTDDWDVRGYRATGQRPTKDCFDSVYTFYGNANGADWGVKEIRFPFYDGDMTDFDPEDDLWLPVFEAHNDWKAGKRVLIRCQAGLNRSGLVMALVLIRDGFTPEDAVELIRAQRGHMALCNSRFENWLINHANVEFWRSKLAA